MKKKIGIFFGSDTGNTKKIAKIIQKKINISSKIYNISKSNKKNLENYNILIFGIPTWYYGEPQSDWFNFFPILKKINFKNKHVALFGCGDQEDYSEYFCDALKYIYDIIIPLGANIIGYWKNSGYIFKKSKSLLNDNNFIGLIIDEDRQPELTNYRIDKWLIELNKNIKNLI
ncbi:flavodoxin FldA [Enterobacterales bacterium endosymbiont of Anomoneura mori]|uniref:flavodoxin FldA n=1 Tax=Enterobacterales bacterium endosymbiont of Anomoneura mori TaxID=3132096 RepID=UPI00399D4BF8